MKKLNEVPLEFLRVGDRVRLTRTHITGVICQIKIDHSGDEVHDAIGRVSITVRDWVHEEVHHCANHIEYLEKT